MTIEKHADYREITVDATGFDDAHYVATFFGLEAASVRHMQFDGWVFTGGTVFAHNEPHSYLAVTKRPIPPESTEDFTADDLGWKLTGKVNDPSSGRG